jgi:hypothetical protein
MSALARKNYGECALALQPDLPEPKPTLFCEPAPLDAEAEQVEPSVVAPVVKLPPRGFARTLDEVEQLPWLESVDDSPKMLRPWADAWPLQSVGPGQLT